MAYERAVSGGRATLDAALQRAVKRASVMRQSFYVVVLLVALAGQVSGAVEALGIPLVAAIPAVGALELGGIVVLANADVRRRLGERAIGSRLLSAAIAVGAVAFNWLAHEDHLLGGFFAGMSALGYLVWLTHTENQRRDRLRATGDLPPTTPAYEVFGHWVRHPLLTLRAKSLAKADPELGLYSSMAAARTETRRERRQKAIAKVLHRKIRSAVDPKTADIALAVYDLDEIAARLSKRADYDGLTDLIAADLTPARLAGLPAGEEAPATRLAELATAALALEPERPEPTLAIGERTAPVADADAAAERPARAVAAERPEPVQVTEVVPARPVPSAALTEPSEEFRVIQAVRREWEELQRPNRATTRAADGESSRRRSRATARVPVQEPPASVQVPVPVPAPPADPEPEPPAANGRRERSLRSRVHAALDSHAPADGPNDSNQLVDLVADVLQLDDVERVSAFTYVQTWQRDATRVPQQAGRS
ncbi:hypothetical protein GCM10022251_70080 [Phytohabitans flavus]|uniref:Uncharacterized protein n=1 Tax=Phytohabitans flavus TaxID=1076124 RepID=A0A6F8Y938_9ACTN|nr:hypothetical protein [Phytohabitans flavus]BCB82471.1 hypothetical protein Pflav_088810 [Phytohabitans flavus]